MIEGMAALNAASVEGFARALDGVFEHAPWVAARAAAARPFGDVGALHAGLMAAVRAAPEAERLAFLNGHPELSAGALPADLTAASRDEQGGAGLGSAAGAEELARLNAAYRVRHGIPFIICLRRHTAADVMRALRRRLGNDPLAERAAALEEVGHVSRLRLAARIAAPDAGPPSGTLTLRVLDGAQAPVPGLPVALEREGAPAGRWVTNAAGGTAGPLLSGEAMRIGAYALRVGVVTLPFELRDPAQDRLLQLRRSEPGWALT